MNARAAASETIEPSLYPAVDAHRRLGELLGLEGKSGASSAQPFPLERVVVRADIVGDCAVTTLEEHYRNTHARPLDVTHTIPLPPDGAVTAFEMVAGERRIRGVCKERETARREFDEARSAGRTAGLVESVRDDVHAISLANVPPHTGIVVRMTIVERLRVDDGRFEYRFPTTISPKFTPGVAIGHDGPGTEADTDRAPDASRLAPPVRLEGGTELDLLIRLPRETTDISGSTALARVDGADGAIELRPARGATCDRDIVVRAWSRVGAPTVRAYSDGERTLVVVDPPASRRPELETPREAVFVLDRSGSMEGERINAAKRALSTALEALGPQDRFEILAFDDACESFRHEPVPATSANIAAARRWIASIEADGGTEALPALERAAIRRVIPGRVRTVLFLTDGDVANDAEILTLVRQLDPATRISCIGIGAAPSRSLLERLARLGGGQSLLISDEQDVEREVRRFESTLVGPMACGLREVDGHHDSGRDLFAGRSTSFFIQGARERVHIRSRDGRFDCTCAVRPSPIPLGALWARDHVAQLEDRIVENPANRELAEDSIRSTGVQFQIQTRLTSFVAIDADGKVSGEPVEIVQPVDRPADAMRYSVACFSMSAPPQLRAHRSRAGAHGMGSPVRQPSPRQPGKRGPTASDIVRRHSARILASLTAAELAAPERCSPNRAAAVLLALLERPFPASSETVDPRIEAAKAFAFAILDPLLPLSVRIELRNAVETPGSDPLRVFRLVYDLISTDNLEELLATGPEA